MCLHYTSDKINLSIRHNKIEFCIKFVSFYTFTHTLHMNNIYFQFITIKFGYGFNSEYNYYNIYYLLNHFTKIKIVFFFLIEKLSAKFISLSHLWKFFKQNLSLHCKQACKQILYCIKLIWILSTACFLMNFDWSNLLSLIRFINLLWAINWFSLDLFFQLDNDIHSPFANNFLI